MGSRGQFDVFLGDELIASKSGAGLVQRLLGGGFPDDDETLAALAKKLAERERRAGA